MMKVDLPGRLLKKMVDNRKIFGAVLCVENGSGSHSWKGAAGNMNPDSKYFIASVTKLYITAVIMRLIEEDKIHLDDKISEYLAANLVKGIHVLKGVDYSNEITVGHLISNKSGLPDYFFHKQMNGRTVADNLMEGNDEPWHLERSIELVKKLKPNFKPGGAKYRASYSDTNYQLLGKIIEIITNRKIADVFNEFIFSPLGLVNSYAYNNTLDNDPVPFYYKSKKIWLPEYMVSITPEGGIVSTAGEVMIFLKEFFNGRFFSKSKIDGLKKWNLILPPPGLFYYGIGLEKLFLPWFVSPIKPIGEIIGFWGQTGSFAFYNPTTDLYFSGTTNQIDGTGHRAITSAILKIVKSEL